MSFDFKGNAVCDEITISEKFGMVFNFSFSL